MSIIKIMVKIHQEYEMASVFVEDGDSLGLPGMLGNFWDFHSGCYSNLKDRYGEFEGWRDLVKTIQLEIIKMGYTPEVNYEYGRVIE